MMKYADLVDNFDVYYRTSADGVNIGGYGSSQRNNRGGTGFMMTFDCRNQSG